MLASLLKSRCERDHSKTEKNVITRTCHRVWPLERSKAFLRVVTSQLEMRETAGGESVARSGHALRGQCFGFKKRRRASTRQICGLRWQGVPFTTPAVCQSSLRAFWFLSLFFPHCLLVLLFARALWLLSRRKEAAVVQQHQAVTQVRRKFSQELLR